MVSATVFSELEPESLSGRKSNHSSQQPKLVPGRSWSLRPEKPSMPYPDRHSKLNQPLWILNTHS